MQPQVKTPTSTQQDTIEILKDKEVVMDVVRTPLVEPQTSVATLKLEETTKKTLEEGQEWRENVNVYTSRFDDENIWANISRSTERLDMEWAKMPPLPKFTPSTQRSSKTKCHCQLYRLYGSKDSLNSDKCKCKNSLNTPYQFADLSKYGNMLTKNLTHNRNTNKTTIPQPLKPTTTSTTTSADCHLFHHEYKHNVALDIKHPSIKRDNSEQDQLDNTNIKVEPNTNTINNVTNKSTNLATPPSTYERSNSRSKYRKTPRLDCHTRTRCYSHDRLMDHKKTEPLTWLQQHLVLKQTIKACYKCPIANYEDRTQSCCSIETPSTACCQAPHVIRACCNNKECLRDVKETSKKAEESTTTKANHITKQEQVPKEEEKKSELAPKPEHDKSTNTEEFKEEKKLTKKKPVKVDINVRLVPKSSKREKPESKLAVDLREPLNPEDVDSTALVPLRNPEYLMDLESQEIRTEF